VDEDGLEQVVRHLVPLRHGAHVVHRHVPHALFWWVGLVWFGWLVGWLVGWFGLVWLVGLLVGLLAKRAGAVCDEMQ
jgi:hypothetical protein